MRVVFLVLLAVLASIGSYAQAPDVIVNEIHNETTPQDGEYTELLIVKDNLDMTGWFIGDNNSDTDSWQPAIRFSNDPLWRNLRRGTYIVIMHSRSGCNGIDQQFDKRAGFIRVCIRNSQYFSGNSTTSMDQNSSGDFIHVVDDNDRHIAGIGYDPNPGGSVRGGTCRTTSGNWTDNSTHGNTPPCGPFMFLQSPLENGESLCHLDSTLTLFGSNPGVILNPGDSRFGITPTGSDGHGNSPSNIKLMISLRKPDWTRQNGCVEALNSGNRLTWTRIEDLNPTDGAIRYMILRSESPDMQMPTQGIAYTPSTRIGSGPTASTVIATNIESTTTTYTDNDPSMQPMPYYRVVAYRYSPTVGLTTPDRGPAYNLQLYASFSGGALPPAPPTTIPTMACNGDTLTFVATPNVGNEMLYSWKFDTDNGVKVAVLDSSNNSVRVVVQNQNPVRDSIQAFLKVMIPASICSPPAYYRFPVVVRPNPSVNVTAVDSLVEAGTDARFIVEVTGSTDLIAQPVVNISTPLDTVSLPFPGGSLTLKVTALIRNLPGCAATDSATVREKFIPIPDSLYYNNIITNNPVNTANKYLRIFGGTVQTIEIRNRWGKKVLKQNSYANDWRGNPGTYFFTAQLIRREAGQDPKLVTLKGWVEVN